jgi:serine/threonine-protein kinase
VHRAYDDHLDTHVAIKLLEPIDGQPATWDEAQILEQLQSEYLLHVFNADIIHGSDIRFITTPIMEGGDLETAIRKEHVDVRRASRWTQQIGHGLERMHASGLLHRDVKPGNVYLDHKGDVQLGDMGMAIQFNDDGKAPANGTPATVAPEALVSSSPHCSRRSDIYSLAATAFFLLSGEYPVDDRLGRAEVRDKVIAGEVRNLRDVAPHVPLSVARVVMRSLSLSPSERASSALAFVNQLATARHPARSWQRITPHEKHIYCLRGGQSKTAKPVNVCTVSDNGKFNIIVQLDSGRRIRRAELEGVTRGSLPGAIRKVIAKL